MWARSSDTVGRVPPADGSSTISLQVCPATVGDSRARMDPSSELRRSRLNGCSIRGARAKARTRERRVRGGERTSTRVSHGLADLVPQRLAPPTGVGSWPVSPAGDRGQRPWPRWRRADHVAQAPVVAPGDLAKPGRDPSDKLTGGGGAEVEGRGEAREGRGREQARRSGASQAGEGRRRRQVAQGRRSRRLDARRREPKGDLRAGRGLSPAAPAPAPAAVGSPPAATPVATNPAAPGPAAQAPRGSDTAGAPINDRTPAGTTAPGGGRVFAGGPSGASASGRDRRQLRLGRRRRPRPARPPARPRDRDPHGRAQRPPGRRGRPRVFVGPDRRPGRLLAAGHRRLVVPGGPRSPPGPPARGAAPGRRAPPAGAASRGAGPDRGSGRRLRRLPRRHERSAGRRLLRRVRARRGAPGPDRGPRVRDRPARARRHGVDPPHAAGLPRGRAPAAQRPPGRRGGPRAPSRTGLRVRDGRRVRPRDLPPDLRRRGHAGADRARLRRLRARHGLRRAADRHGGGDRHAADDRAASGRRGGLSVYGRPRRRPGRRRALRLPPRLARAGDARRATPTPMPSSIASPPRPTPPSTTSPRCSCAWAATFPSPR